MSTRPSPVAWGGGRVGPRCRRKLASHLLGLAHQPHLLGHQPGCAGKRSGGLSSVRLAHGRGSRRHMRFPVCRVSPCFVVSRCGQDGAAWWRRELGRPCSGVWAFRWDAQAQVERAGGGQTAPGAERPSPRPASLGFAARTAPSRPFVPPLATAVGRRRLSRLARIPNLFQHPLHRVDDEDGRKTRIQSSACHSFQMFSRKMPNVWAMLQFGAGVASFVQLGHANVASAVPCILELSRMTWGGCSMRLRT